jgi:YidC/Oxa1 family membrane protein insertase
MDRNSITGLLLIFLVLSLYFQFFAAPPIEQDTEVNKQEQVKKQEEFSTKNQEKVAELDSAGRQKAYGMFAALSEGKSKKISVENEEVKITFNTQGGKVESVFLKGYKTFDQKPIMLLDANNSQMDLKLKTKSGQVIDLYDLYFETKAPEEIKLKGKAAKISFRAELGSGEYVEQIYSLSPKGYLLDYKLNIVGLEKAIDTNQGVQFVWSDQMRKFEKDLYYARYYATINYSSKEGDYNYLNWPSESQEEKDFEKENVHWFSFKQRFFSAALIAKNRNLQNVKLISNTPKEDSSTVKSAQAYAQISYADIKAGKADFQFYFGPNDYNILRKLKIENLDKNVHLGWAPFAVVSKYVIIPLFSLLEGVFSNYGIIIFLIVLIIKTFLLPLTYKSYLAMAKTRVLNEYIQPELEKFKTENGIKGGSIMGMNTEDQQKVQKKQMELSSELGSSPFAAMGGCIPLMLQMPILLALFIFFPNAIELRQEGFLWADDLSTYDSILDLPFYIYGYGSHVSLFTLLMTLSTIGLTYFNNQNQSSAAMQGPMKNIGYFMPVVFMFVLNSYPAGLSLYYLVQNVVTIGQQELIKRFFIDEEKIKEKFEEYKRKNKGKKSNKSGFLVRLQEKAQEAQKIQKEKEAAKRDEAAKKDNGKK